MLEHLIRSPLCTAAVDIRCAAGLLKRCAVCSSRWLARLGGGCVRVRGSHAPSHTSSHHTLLSVQVPRQWTPSACAGPMNTLESVAPASRMKMVSASPVSSCSAHTLAAAVLVSSCGRGALEGGGGAHGCGRTATCCHCSCRPQRP